MTTSPNGWHKSNEISTTDTSGNNAVAYKGLDQNILPISIPIIDKLLTPKGLFSQTSCQSNFTNNYDYPFDQSKGPIEKVNVDAARVNAFYVVNKMHDLTVCSVFA
jgi:extracellular elastinolytic metalloproteinase